MFTVLCSRPITEVGETLSMMFTASSVRCTLAAYDDATFPWLGCRPCRLGSVKVEVVVTVGGVEVKNEEIDDF